MKKYILILLTLPVILYSQDPAVQSKMPDFSHKRGFYKQSFFLVLTSESPNAKIRYTTDCTKPDKNNGILYTDSILITETRTIRAVAYEETTLVSKVRTHSFIFPENVLTQNNYGVPREEHSQDHVFWTEHFDIRDVTQSDEEMIEALMDIPTMYIAAPWDSIFGISGIHRGQNLEEFGGDPPDPGWRELVECSVEMIYPETYRNGQIRNLQENCGIKIQGGASRWYNGSLDHKQSFTLEFKSRYGDGTLKNDWLISAPFNHGTAPEKVDKIILRTGFNRDWGSDWDRANVAYTRDQFGRDLQIMMSGWGCHGTYVHLYILGKYWGIFNPCERMDNDALAIYFGGESEDYFYGKGKEGPKEGSADRYHHLNNTDWTNIQLDELEDYLAVDNYIDVALIHCYSNAGDSPQYYFGNSTIPPGPLYFMIWDLEDSFDGGALRSGPPVSMENYDMPWSQDKFDAYFQIKNNIDFRIKFADRVFKHCFNNGILTDQRVTAIWDSSCRVIEKAILCEIARWGDEWGDHYDYQHWKSECQDVRHDLIGRADLLVAELRKSGMYTPAKIPILDFKIGDEIITTPVYNCLEGSSLTIAYPVPWRGSIYYTYDGSDPRAWDLTGNPSASAVDTKNQIVTFPITHATIIKARIKDGSVWSPLQELKIIPKITSPVVINEINYNSEADFDTEDWVEIYNNSETDISLAGWKIKDSNDNNTFEFGPNTVLERDSYLVICNDTTAFKTWFADVENLIGNMDFKFSSEGDAVRILDNNNTLIDLVLYNTEDPWPVEAAGNGPTLELINPYFDNVQAENWKASKDHGSPGHRNSRFIITAIHQNEGSQEILKNFTLLQNYPNPFNPRTKINYELPIKNYVEISIYNVIGQKIAILVSESKPAGKYTVEWNASGYASGVYYYELKTIDYHDVKKMILIK